LGGHAHQVCADDRAILADTHAGINPRHPTPDTGTVHRADPPRHRQEHTPGKPPVTRAQSGESTNQTSRAS
jgi:hypothetical protein